MICWYTLLWRNVAEHSFLLVIVAAHSLVSLDFLYSDEFFELKLQRKCVFQQTANDTLFAPVQNKAQSITPLHVLSGLASYRTGLSATVISIKAQGFASNPKCLDR